MNQRKDHYKKTTFSSGSRGPRPFSDSILRSNEMASPFVAPPAGEGRGRQPSDAPPAVKGTVPAPCPAARSRGRGRGSEERGPSPRRTTRNRRSGRPLLGPATLAMEGERSAAGQRLPSFRRPWRPPPACSPTQMRPVARGLAPRLQSSTRDATKAWCRCAPPAPLLKARVGTTSSPSDSVSPRKATHRRIWMPRRPPYHGIYHGEVGGSSNGLVESV
jgi:hypothetical protein